MTNPTNSTMPTSIPHPPTPPKVQSSMGIAILLTAAGGFLDAFTYVGHGHVFANAMTGNVVFLAISAACGMVMGSWHYLLSISAFLVGIFLAYLLRRGGRRLPFGNTAMACLLLEIFFLAIVSFLPESFPDVILVPGIALVAAMQNSSFTHLKGWTYNSVMTTGNLRHMAEAFFAGTVPRRNSEALHEAGAFGIICFSFVIGAAVGALATPHWHNQSLWLPIITMLAALLICWIMGE